MVKAGSEGSEAMGSVLCALCSVSSAVCDQSMGTREREASPVRALRNAAAGCFNVCLGSVSFTGWPSAVGLGLQRRRPVVWNADLRDETESWTF